MSSTYGTQGSEGIAYKVPNKHQEKKMGFFSRWFDRKVKEAWERARNEPESPVMIRDMPDTRLDAEGMNIRLFSATGGTIVEFRRYDRIKDRADNKMYVIPTEHNFSEQFSKIVNIEMLR